MQHRLRAIIRELCACSCIGAGANQLSGDTPDTAAMSQSDLEPASTQREDVGLLGNASPTSHTVRTLSETARADGKVQGGQLILCKSLQDVKNTTLNIAEVATPCRFRLVDCHRLLHENELCIYEFEQFPTAIPYAAVSYVWRGNPPSSDWEEEYGTFSVKGAEDGDPISLDVLKSVSKAVSLGLHFVVGPFLWLDRLCILQTDKSDKAWQISRMYQIYKSCMVCIVLPGGIGRLVRLDEETGWIHRGWTLQEALVPEKVAVLFLFSRKFFNEGEDVDKALKDCENCDQQDFAPLQRGNGGWVPHPYLKVTKRFGRTAWMPLDTLLDSATMNPNWELTNSLGYSSLLGMPPPDDMSNNPAILGGYTECELLQMARTASSGTYQGRQEWREQAIWRASFIRTSSRPVDMVYSIMQLFDINLDTTKFEKDDRLRATIALASEILDKGKTASWLAALFTLDPNPQICTFPRFPMTSVAGKALVKKADGDEVEMVTELEKIPTYRWLDHAPSGRMDKDGYLTFTRAAVRIARVSNTEISGVDHYSGPKEIDGFMHFAAEDESLWRIHPEASESEKLDEKPRAFMVFLGMQVGHIWSADEPEPEGDSIVLVIEEHAPERFHKISSFVFWQSFNYLIRQGRDRQFHLGGPGVV
ncbi:hypothetical protein K435DRAFT_791720 [Dendrothele bispora CBS 962.96]|uniref:Heterokaryon incompatibility domain-containing protein n=1 Tax=Dendrothele bispora (strain CBS 962.96) TaxID=1314807 RepID=A0A4S8MLM2_DENBC|nr:hypothetical protein K435DRAFT_791720 [Dendrothele bispora CBS 962.96]